MCQRIDLDICPPGQKERWGGEVGKWEVIRGFIITSFSTTGTGGDGGYVTGLAQGAIPFSPLGHCLTPAEIRDGLR